MGVELKPCPFCGGKAVRYGGKWHRIKCTVCKAETDRYLKTIEEAESKWNRREPNDSNGKCSYWKQDTEYGICEPMQTVEAIQIPTPHGRLMDAKLFADTICQAIQSGDLIQKSIWEWIADAPTILDKEKE